MAERDSHSFETKWLERGMCERALVGALVSRSGRHRMAPLRIAYSMLRAVTPQTQLRELKRSGMNWKCWNYPAAAAAAVKHTTRTLSGPPSTGAAIAMDGGVADTACYYTGR